MDKPSVLNERLGRQLVLDELFDLSLYKTLRGTTRGDLQKTLDELIPVETKHYAFWQDFYRLKIEKLDLGRRLKLKILALISKIFGEPAVYLILEAIEIYGIRKYLNLWSEYRDTPFAQAVRTILEDEFGHEDSIVSGVREKKIDPERIRNIFLGFNDGLVEFLGAVGGFFAAFQEIRPVLIASLTGAAAGAFSMAVGVFASSGSEAEMQKVALRKKEFLSGRGAGDVSTTARPLSSAVIVGIAYLFGAAVPIMPLLFGAQSVWISWLWGAVMVVFVTTILSLISGMRIRKRVAANFVMIAAAVAAAYAIGILTKNFFNLGNSGL